MGEWAQQFDFDWYLFPLMKRYPYPASVFRDWSMGDIVDARIAIDIETRLEEMKNEMQTKEMASLRDSMKTRH